MIDDDGNSLVTIESLLDDVETLLAQAETPEQPPRPNLSLPTDARSRSNPFDTMTLNDNGIKGRGWFAKQDIDAGTVLVCEKPLAMVMDWQDPSLLQAESDLDDQGLEDFERDPENLEMQEHESGLSKLNDVLLLDLLRQIAKDAQVEENQKLMN